ncbi:unnamed protein product [Blepharisma stoltei]|uniref:Kelch motif family protein n=1 Tax=Blepharisma stoltei TaxID=1481888 RepID=A0AAU9K5S4_9CILI|nr:unnamed protein product [Blepharisma stoltei]
MKCHIEGCLSASDFVCSCQNYALGICKDHVLNHLEIVSFAAHQLKAFKNTESEVIIFELAQKIEELSQERAKITTNIYNEIKNLNFQLNQTVEKINKEIGKIEEIIQSLILSDPVARSTVNLDEIRRYSTQEHIKEIVAASTEVNIDIPCNEFSSEAIKSKISCFKPRSTTIITYNLEDFSLREIKIENLENPPKDTSMCLLPNGNIFCYGSRNHGIYSGTTFIIDELYQAKYLVQGISCTFAGLIYLDKFVYAFGGNNGYDMENVQKYDLIKNEWVSLKPLEIPTAYITCASYFNFIYYSGAGIPGVYQYDISENCHQNVLPLKDRSKKTIFKGNGRIYVYEKPGFLYEQNPEEDMDHWTQIRKSDRQDLKILSYGVEFGNSVYFILKRNKLFRFDLARKVILEEDRKTQ